MQNQYSKLHAARERERAQFEQAFSDHMNGNLGDFRNRVRKFNRSKLIAFLSWISDTHSQQDLREILQDIHKTVF